MGHNKYLLYILCLVLISIFGYLSISYSPSNQREITEAGGTLAVLLIVISGIFVAIYGSQELSKEEKKNQTTTQHLYTMTPYNN